MSPVFHPDTCDPAIQPDSWWRRTAPTVATAALDGDTQADVAIIGGGYCGLSTALHLTRDHGLAAVVLEAGQIGWGGSGRSGGFVTFPAAKLSAEAMIRRYGLEEARRFHDEGRAACDLVAELLEDEGITAERQGDATYEVAHAPGITQGLADAARLYRDQLGVDASFLTREAFAEIGHGGTEQFGALRFGGCFGLNPMKFVTGLAKAAQRRGAVLHTGSRVTGWRREGADHVLETASGSVRARQVVVAANGYLPDDLNPTLANRTLPALSNIIVTRPLTASELDGAGWKTDCPVSNARDLLFYYRLLPDRRFLFGARGGTWGDARENDAMRAWLTRRMGEVFPSFAGAEIAHFWNGLVAITPRKVPVICRLPDDATVHVAYGCHGAGVALMPWAGRAIARSIAGVAPIEVLPAPYRGLSRSMFAPIVRRWALRAAYAWYGWKERRG